MALKIIFFLGLFVGVAAQTGSADLHPVQATNATLDQYKATKALAAKNKAEAAADEAKRSMINKVVVMIEALRNKVNKEREDEQITHLDFTRYCDTNVAKKLKSISKLAGLMGESEAAISSLNGQITAHKQTVSSNDGLITTEKATRVQTKLTDKAAFTDYEKNMADMSTAIMGVTQAIAALKTSVGKPSLLQIQSARSDTTLDTAVMLAEALGMEGAKSARQATIFLQGGLPGQEMNDYSTHSGGIITMLEKLTTDFQTQKNTLETTEASRKMVFNVAVQGNADQIKLFETDRDVNQRHSDRKTKKKSDTEQTLKEDTAEKADDTQYLAKLQAGQAAKLSTFNQRQAAMQNEIGALDATKTTLKQGAMAKITRKSALFSQIGTDLRIAGPVANNEGIMELLEQEAEETEAAESPLGFLQKKSKVNKQVTKHTSSLGYDNTPDILSLLKTQGQQWGSAVLLDMTAHVAGDPLGKVKTLIESKITTLLEQADKEAHLAYCDKDIKEETEKRDKHIATIKDLTSDITSNTALQNKLTDQIAKLNAAIADLDAASTKSWTNRNKTKIELDSAESTARQGKILMANTITTLDRFYKTAAISETSAQKSNSNTTRTGFEDKAKAAASAAKAGKVDPFAKAPGAGFDSEDTYGSDSSGGDSIIALMDVIKSDFKRTEDTSKKDNAQSKADNKKFQTDTEMEKREKLMVRRSRTQQRDEIRDVTNPDLTSQKTSEIELLGGSTSTRKAGSVEALAALMVKCKPPTMTYAQRVAKREAEMASLNSAWDMLDKRKQVEE